MRRPTPPPPEPADEALVAAWQERLLAPGPDAGRAALLGGWAPDQRKLVLRQASACWVWDADGHAYLDATSQAWSANIGHAHPRVMAAAAAQMRLLTHARSAYDSPILLTYAERLQRAAPGGNRRIAFSLHGSTAIESALKLLLKNRSDTPGPVVTLNDGYHGRTLAGLSLSWPHTDARLTGYGYPVRRTYNAYCYRCPLGLHYPSCGIACADRFVTVASQSPSRPLALLMEPVQGNGGQINFPAEYHRAMARHADSQRVPLVWDEIQTAFGRLPTLFAAELYDVSPDIIVVGKAMAGGFPLAAVLAKPELGTFAPGDDALTFGQFPVSLAAADAVLDVIEQEDILARGARAGELLLDGLRSAAAGIDGVGEVRGVGLALALELVDAEGRPDVAAALRCVAAAQSRGVLLGTSRYGELGHVVKVKPPAVIADDEIEFLLEVVRASLAEAWQDRQGGRKAEVNVGA